MKNLKKVIAIVMVAMVMVSSFAVTSLAAPSSKDRYSVLVLDCSGSMSGTKIAELKDGATAFCEQVLKSNRNTNKVAIVTFASYTNLACEFTDDLETLKNTISGLYASGGTNLAGGLTKAKETLEVIPGDVIRNMIVMCDGSPDSTSAAYEVVKSVPLFWNIYGLCYCLGGEQSYASQVMKNVGRNGHYEVTDGSSLLFSFVDSSDTITTESVNNTVIHIACPVDVSVTLNGVTLDKNNTQTTFGTLEFAGENGEEKIVTLSYRNDYIVEIVGTGEGTMDYSIAYNCNGDELYNLTYPTVDITSTTKITTGVDVDKSDMTLDIDSDGDGIVDETVAPNVSTTSIWYKIKTFFEDLFYKIKDFFIRLFSGELFE